MSNLKFSLNGKSLSPAKFEANIRDFKVIIDEPESLGGTDLAPNPVEYLLASYAGCLNVVSFLIAKELDFELRGLEIKIEGELNPNKLFGTSLAERAGYKGLKVVLIPDTDAEVALLGKWIQTVEARCPINDNLTNATPIVVSVQKDFKQITPRVSLN